MNLNVLDNNEIATKLLIKVLVKDGILEGLPFLSKSPSLSRTRYGIWINFLLHLVLNKKIEISLN